MAMRKVVNQPHHIAEWADHRGMKQSDIVRQLDVDKSVVSRWFGGSVPSREYQEMLAKLFHCEVESLFRNPDEDWFVWFFQGRSIEEIKRMKDTLEAAFPKEKSKDKENA